MAARGRFIGSMGEAFIGTDHGSTAPAGAGQPVIMRMRDIPYMPDYKGYAGAPSLARIFDWLKRLRTLVGRA